MVTTLRLDWIDDQVQANGTNCFLWSGDDIVLGDSLTALFSLLGQVTEALTVRFELLRKHRMLPSLRDERLGARHTPFGFLQFV